MRDGLMIRTMTRDDVDFAIRLANREGWNPGLSDADCFYAADPEGFFIAEVNGTPAGTISAVRYDGDFGFLGLYIMTREERGKGYGMELWKHAVQHLDGCTIGLDAVTEQEPTYVRSGFEPHYRSIRFEGKGGGTTPEGVTPLTDIPLKAVLKYDRQCFPGGREPFMRAWLDAIGVKGYGVLKDDELVGFGVIRPCAMGYKIGPLFADDPDTAETLYTALAAHVPGERFFLDVIEPNEPGMAMVKRHDLEKVFETVRMYVGDAPDMNLEKIYGVTSFELG